MKFSSVHFQVKVFEQYLPVELFIMMYKMAFEFVTEILR